MDYPSEKRVYTYIYIIPISIYLSVYLYVPVAESAADNTW